MMGGDGSKRIEEAMDGEYSSKQPLKWETILPRRSLRVLLVESDDATRHIVTALLRKCNYRVAGVADGMKAWEVMKEKKYIFDLVLTEVAMPTLSGIGLLTKIMGAEECKNIPVIMMSTHDSVNVVLNCMLKGAVDFLVKPVRKNELRNLWQHVWRRHSVLNSPLNAPEDTTASNQISANVSGRSKNDENSDAQSSGNKQEDYGNNRMQSPEQPPPSEDRYTDKVEASQSSDKDMLLERSASKIVDDQSVTNVREQGQPLGISSFREVNNDLKRKTDKGYDHGSVTNGREQRQRHNISSSREANNDLMKKIDETYDPRSIINAREQRQHHNISSSRQAHNDLMRKIDETYVPRSVTIVREQSHPPNISSSKEVNNDLLRKIDETYDPRLCLENKILNPDRPAPKMIVFVEPKSDRRCSFSVLKNATLEDKLFGSAESTFANKEPNVVAAPVLELSVRRPQPDGYAQLELKERHVIKPSVASAFSRYGDKKVQALTEHVERSTNNERNTFIAYTDKRIISSTQRNGVEATIYFQVSSTNNEKPSLPPQPSTIHYPQFGFLPIPCGTLPYHQYGALMQPMVFPDISLASHNSTQILSNHTIDISEPKDSEKLYYVNEKTFNNGSSSHDFVKCNDSGNIEDGARNGGVSLEFANENGTQKLDCSRREAALLKFRLKRKDRCFKKKVRYHSRKQLAEQRPRIKGQFVRQKVIETTTRDVDRCH